MQKRFFNTNEAAHFLQKELGVPIGTKKTLESWRCQGRGPAYRRLSGRIFYSREALESFARGEQVQTADSING
jgi:hypothetical protein